MTPAQRELRKRLTIARNDCYHDLATVLRLVADGRYADAANVAEVLRRRIEDARELSEAWNVSRGK